MQNVTWFEIFAVLQKQKQKQGKIKQTTDKQTQKNKQHNPKPLWILLRKK